MKKRFICFALTIIMLLSVVLTGCSSAIEQQDGSTPTVDTSAKTLTMFVVTETPVNYGDPATLTEEEIEIKKQYDAVEAAITKITKSKFKVDLKIYFYTIEEYYSIIEEKITAMETVLAEKELQKKIEKAVAKAAKARGLKYVTTAAPETTPAPEETVLNEIGMSELKYPDVKENQVDILYIGNYQKFNEYIEKSWLSKLNDELSGTSKKLYEFIFPMFWDGVKSGSGYYAVPSNSALNEFTYMMVNKELLNKYYFSTTQMSSIYDEDTLEFLDIIKENEPSYSPLAYDSIRDPQLVHYWSVNPDTLSLNPDKFSVLGSVYYNSITLGDTLGFTNLFAVKSFKTQLSTLKRFEYEGYYATESEKDKPFAISIVKGGKALVDKYSEDYEFVLIESPRITSDTLYGNMFGVSAYTTSLSKSMQIITYLNTNSDMRNLLAYGIEGVNYELTSDGVVSFKEGNLYNMDINKTGNVFVASPPPGSSVEAWELEKQLLNNAKLDVLAGFAFTADDDLDIEIFKTMESLSEEAQKMIDACTSVEELEKAMEDISSMVSRSADIKKARDNAYKPEEGEGNSPYTVYYNWLIEKGFIVIEQ